MRAMILAAGLGTRLLPLTKTIPKPMIEVAQKPLLEHQLEWFKRNNITEIAINLFHLPEKIISYFGDGSRFGIRIKYSNENCLLGTAGGVKKVEDFFTETFVVYYGDNYTYLNLNEMIAFHKRKGATATIFLRKREKIKKISSLIEIDADNRIVTFIEKPSEEQMVNYKLPYFLSNNGIYVLEPEVLKFIPKETFYDFGKDVFPKLLELRKKVYGFMEENSFWRELGTLEKYKIAKEEIEKRLETEKVFK